MSEIWCVASGKGGVGKTLISSGFGISLAKLRKKVLLVDFDLSGANLHTILGLPQNKNSILDHSDSAHEIKALITKSTFSNLDFISGFTMPHLNHELGLLKAESLVQNLKILNYDIVIFDLGPGASKANLTLMNFANKNFLVTNCEPTSIEKTYRFVDQMVEEKSEIRNLQLMVNFCRSTQHRSLGNSIESVIFKKHAIKAFYAGSVQFDNAVWQSTFMSTSQVQNVFALMPYSEVCHDFYKICKQFIDPSELRAVS